MVVKGLPYTFDAVTKYGIRCTNGKMWACGNTRREALRNLERIVQSSRAIYPVAKTNNRKK